MTRLLAVIVASAVAANCATGAYNLKPGLHGDHVVFTLVKQDPPAVTAAYIRALPLGSKVTIRTTDGTSMKAVLMLVQEEAIVVRPRTRVPERAQTVPFDRILAIDVDRENGVARAVAIGAGVGAGAALGLLFVLAALLGD